MPGRLRPERQPNLTEADRHALRASNPYTFPFLPIALNHIYGQTDQFGKTFSPEAQGFLVDTSLAFPYHESRLPRTADDSSLRDDYLLHGKALQWAVKAVVEAIEKCTGEGLWSSLRSSNARRMASQGAMDWEKRRTKPWLDHGVFFHPRIVIYTLLVLLGKDALKVQYNGDDAIKDTLEAISTTLLRAAPGELRPEDPAIRDYLNSHAVSNVWEVAKIPIMSTFYRDAGGLYKVLTASHAAKIELQVKGEPASGGADIDLNDTLASQTTIDPSPLLDKIDTIQIKLAEIHRASTKLGEVISDRLEDALLAAGTAVEKVIHKISGPTGRLRMARHRQERSSLSLNDDEPLFMEDEEEHHADRGTAGVSHVGVNYLMKAGRGALDQFLGLSFDLHPQRDCLTGQELRLRPSQRQAVCKIMHHAYLNETTRKVRDDLGVTEQHSSVVLCRDGTGMGKTGTAAVVLRITSRSGTINPQLGSRGDEALNHAIPYFMVPDREGLHGSSEKAFRDWAEIYRARGECGTFAETGAKFPSALPSIIIAPLSAIPQWKRELRRFGAGDMIVTISRAGQYAAAMRAIPDEARPMATLIMTRGVLSQLYTNSIVPCECAQDTPCAHKDGRAMFRMGGGFALCVIDEAHCARRISVTHKAIHALSSCSQFRLLLTATPYCSDLCDFAMVMRAGGLKQVESIVDADLSKRPPWFEALRKKEQRSVQERRQRTIDRLDCFYTDPVQIDLVQTLRTAANGTATIQEHVTDLVDVMFSRIGASIFFRTKDTIGYDGRPMLVVGKVVEIVDRFELSEEEAQFYRDTISAYVQRAGVNSNTLARFSPFYGLAKRIVVCPWVAYGQMGVAFNRDSTKLKRLVHILNALVEANKQAQGRQKKALIYYGYCEDFPVILEFLARHHHYPLVLDGATSISRREEFIERINNEEPHWNNAIGGADARQTCLVLASKVVVEAINLHNIDEIILLSHGFTPAETTQLAGRAARTDETGQIRADQITTITHLLAVNTADDPTWDIINQKADNEAQSFTKLKDVDPKAFDVNPGPANARQPRTIRKEEDVNVLLRREEAQQHWLHLGVKDIVDAIETRPQLSKYLTGQSTSDKLEVGDGLNHTTVTLPPKSDPKVELAERYFAGINLNTEAQLYNRIADEVHRTSDLVNKRVTRIDIAVQRGVERGREEEVPAAVYEAGYKAAQTGRQTAMDGLAPTEADLVKRIKEADNGGIPEAAQFSEDYQSFMASLASRLPQGTSMANVSDLDGLALLGSDKDRYLYALNQLCLMQQRVKNCGLRVGELPTNEHDWPYVVVEAGFNDYCPAGGRPRVIPYIKANRILSYPTPRAQRLSDGRIADVPDEHTNRTERMRIMERWAQLDHHPLAPSLSNTHSDRRMTTKTQLPPTPSEQIARRDRYVTRQQAGQQVAGSSRDGNRPPAGHGLTSHTAQSSAQEQSSSRERALEAEGVGPQARPRQPGQRQIRPRPAGQQSAGQRPVGQRPVGQQPAGERPVGQRPIGQQPVGQRPVGQQSARQRERSSGNGQGSRGNQSDGRGDDTTESSRWPQQALTNRPGTPHPSSLMRFPEQSPTIRIPEVPQDPSTSQPHLPHSVSARVPLTDLSTTITQLQPPDTNFQAQQTAMMPHGTLFGDSRQPPQSTRGRDDLFDRIRHWTGAANHSHEALPRHDDRIFDTATLHPQDRSNVDQDMDRYQATQGNNIHNNTPQMTTPRRMPHQDNLQNLQHSFAQPVRQPKRQRIEYQPHGQMRPQHNPQSEGGGFARDRNTSSRLGGIPANFQPDPAWVMLNERAHQAGNM